MFFALFLVIQCLSLVDVHDGLCLSEQKPKQLRVALRGANAVTVSWSTNSFFGINQVANARVEYSTDAGLVGAVRATGTSRNYNLLSFFHDVPVLNLAASTRYYYRVVASGCVQQSDIRSFRTPPAAGSQEPLNVTYVADVGNDNLLNGGGATRTINALRAIAPSTNFFIHPGDISYADDYGVLLPFEFYEEAWNKWQDNMEEITSNNIYMTGPGNHEVTCFQVTDAVCPANYKNFSAYLHRFRMPGDESNGFKNLWYSFDYGMVHMIFINTETDFPNAPSGPGTALNGGNFLGLSGQLQWLENDLQQAVANRGQVPWIVVAGHRPFFGSQPKGSSLVSLFGAAPICDSCRNAFQSLLRQYNVDLYLAGHVHWYERLFPVDENGNKLSESYVNPPGPVFIINGAGGAPEGAAQIDTTIAASAKIVTGFGYSKLQFKDASNLRVSFVSSDTNQEVDAVDIVRDR